MPRIDRLKQSLFAAVMIPAIAMSLTACASSGDTSSGAEDLIEQTSASQPESSAAPRNPDDGASKDDAGDGASSGSPDGADGASGENIVKWGEYDLSEKDWEIECHDDYVVGDVFEGDEGEIFHAVSVSLAEDGSVDYVLIESGEADSMNYAEGVDESAYQANATYDVNNVIEVSGVGWLNEYDELVEFEVKLTCDYSL